MRMENLEFRIKNEELKKRQNKEFPILRSKFLILFFVIGIILTRASSPCRAAGLGEMEKSVVMIRSTGQEFDFVTPWKPKAMQTGVGSGFIIDANRVLTNAHNVSNNKYVELQKEGVAKRFPAMVAFIGHDCDLAILDVADKSFFDDTIALKLAELPGVNTTVSTYGFPLGGKYISVTEGVISRIQVDTYAHTGADAHLVIQTDAAINPGNSGGPVMQDGNVVGVAFQGLRQAENIGYMIPTTVIRHFLKDIEDGKYDGFGSLGVMLYPGLHNASYRQYLKVPEGEQGVVIIDTMMKSSVEKILQREDVLVQLDDYKIDDDGRIDIYGMKLDLSEAVETKQIGETVEISFYRDGELNKATAKVALNRPVFEIARQYDIEPRYVCFAGFVFVPATRNYLETWGQEWMFDIPFYLRYLFRNSLQLNKDRDRKEYVVLSEIMPDEINAYAGEFKSQVVESINGSPVWQLDDVWKAFEKTSEDFYIVKFMETQRPMIIDAKVAQARQAEILKKYDIPQAAMLEGSK
jgi:S1-C subfamily serine protease